MKRSALKASLCFGEWGILKEPTPVLAFGFPICLVWSHRRVSQAFDLTLFLPFASVGPYPAPLPP